MRYQFVTTNKRFDGKRVYNTTYYPVIPLDSTDIYITSSEGEYLDSLSKRYYGDESYWWIIANANNLGNGKLSVPVGKQIRIPGNLPRIIQLFTNLN